MPDEPPAHPYRIPWKAAERAAYPASFAGPDALRRYLANLRTEVDAGRLEYLSPDDLALTIRELVEARDRLRRRVRPVRTGLLYVVSVVGSSGVLLMMLKMPRLAWPAQLSAAVVVLVGGWASEWLLQWLDALPEYDGLIADLRKVAEARRAAGPLVRVVVDDSADEIAQTPSETPKRGTR